MGRAKSDDNLEGFVVLREWIDPKEGPQRTVIVPENGGPLYSTTGRAKAQITRSGRYNRGTYNYQTQQYEPGPDITYTVVSAKIVVEYPPEDTGRDWAKVDLP